MLLCATSATAFVARSLRPALRTPSSLADARLVSSASSEEDAPTPSSATATTLPKLLVFDLDHTLWTPELYTLRRLPGYQTAAPPGPVADADVSLFPGAAAVLEAEIYTGGKAKHFEALRDKSGVAYEDMLFFDDARDGKYGNCEAVPRLGVMSAHTPGGLDAALFDHALAAYAERRDAGRDVGVIVDRPAGAGRAAATIKSWRPEKGFGFCTVPGEAKDVFFHRSSVSGSVDALRAGAEVTVTVGRDGRGRKQCDSVALAGAEDADVVRLPCFSMNMPFAGLVAHGYKTLETRNHTMFVPLEGQTVALHVGRRTYPDGGAHRDIMARDGLSEADIDRLTTLPDGAARGTIVALVDVGETVLVDDVAERSLLAVETGAVATGAAMGRYLTTMKNARFLDAPVPTRGRPGFFDAAIPRALAEKYGVAASA
ncbi:hypothetical protein JL722_6336 [Aureococcus anophagefferens]|nr:hypothetical protein JL722_6336 [Aureococcus anophagefferens]